MNQGRNQKNGWVIALIGAIAVMFVAFVAVMYSLFSQGKLSLNDFDKEKVEKEDLEDLEDFSFDFSFGDAQEAEKETETEEETESVEEDYREVASEDEETAEEDAGRHDYYGDYEYSGADSEWMTTFYDDGYDIEDFAFLDPATGEWYYETIKDALKSNLDYTVEWKEYQYDSGFDNVSIWAVYPQIVGDSVPNREYLNDVIASEIAFWTTTYEDNLAAGYISAEDEFTMDLSGYVTYMDEELMSVVFYEEGLDEDGSFYYLYSVNIDIKNGIVLDNASIIDIDEEFAVEFRTRNAQQNVNTSGVDAMSDQEIVENLTSPTMGAVFYTPLGLEVGINVDYGYNTVTFRDYEKYLKQL